MHAEAARIKMAKHWRRQIIDKRRGGLCNAINTPCGGKIVLTALFAPSRRAIRHEQAPVSEIRNSTSMSARERLNYYYVHIARMRTDRATHFQERNFQQVTSG
jgi:hypothetical protein